MWLKQSQMLIRYSVCYIACLHFTTVCHFRAVKAEDIKRIRTTLGLSQMEFAGALGVSFATVNRWENDKAQPQKDRIARIQNLLAEKWGGGQGRLEFESAPARPPALNFAGDPDAIKLVVD